MAVGASNVEQDVTAPVRSILIPLNGVHALLPNASVAEIITYRDPEGQNDSLAWFGGFIPWRGTRTPLLILEPAVAQSVPKPSRRSHVVVLSTLSKRADMPFLAVLASGIPHLIQADKNVVQPVEQGITSPIAMAHVTVAGQPAIIPDLTLMEKMARKVRNEEKVPT